MILPIINMEQESVVLTENKSIDITQSTNRQNSQEIKTVILTLDEETQTIEF